MAKNGQLKARPGVGSAILSTSLSIATASILIQAIAGMTAVLTARTLGVGEELTLSIIFGMAVTGFVLCVKQGQDTFDKLFRIHMSKSVLYLKGLGPTLIYSIVLVSFLMAAVMRG